MALVEVPVVATFGCSVLVVVGVAAAVARVAARGARVAARGAVVGLSPRGVNH